MQPFDGFLDPVHSFLAQATEIFPKVLLGILILVFGWLIAKLIRFAVVKALRAINFNVLTEKAGLDTFLKQGGGETDTTGILGLLVYWLIILTALLIASNSVGLAAVTELIGKVVLFVPRVIVAVIILAFGAYFARFIGMTVTAYCKNLDMPDAALLGRLAMYAIVIFVAMIAIDHLGLGDIIRQTFLIILIGVALALALAFGLGGQKRAADFLDRWSRRGRTHGDDDRDRPPGR
jgi:mechanosensitive ion channel-like protein